MRFARRPSFVRVLVLTVAATASSLAAPVPSEAGGHREIEVMTQNLYLGSSLTLALEAPDLPSFVLGVANIYATMLRTDFPTRAEAIADQIAAEQPDIIGLQEVSNWIAQPTKAGPAPKNVDFLAILQAELAERHLDYAVVATSNNANIGPVPLVAPPFGCVNVPTPPALPDCVVTLRDRDVILVNGDADVEITAATNGNFTAQETASIPGAGAVSFNRGWAAIDAKLDGASFRVVNTHLEVEAYPVVQEAQARELLAGPLHTRRPVIAVGDFNSAADGSTTRTYHLLVRALFLDAWWTNLGRPGPTCCQAEALDNPASELSSRIDLVLARLALPTSAHRVNHAPFQSIAPYWPSDHAGVVATVRIF